MAKSKVKMSDHVYDLVLELHHVGYANDVIAAQSKKKIIIKKKKKKKILWKVITVPVT